jgi:hypothetical protein
MLIAVDFGYIGFSTYTLTWPEIWNMERTTDVLDTFILLPLYSSDTLLPRV